MLTGSLVPSVDLETRNESDAISRGYDSHHTMGDSSSSEERKRPWAKLGDPSMPRRQPVARKGWLMGTG